MKYTLIIATICWSLSLSSCDQPPEQQESESAIRDSALREDAAERAKQKSDAKETLKDTLKEKTSLLLLYQGALTDAKSNLSMANDQMNSLIKSESAKPASETREKIKNQSLKINVLEEEVEKQMKYVTQTQLEMDKLKAELEKLQ